MPFIGVAPPGETRTLLEAEGALTVLDDINQLEAVLNR
jgi:hypothetical protein